MAGVREIAESLDIVAVQGCPCLIEFGKGSVGFVVGSSEEAERPALAKMQGCQHLLGSGKGSVGFVAGL
jgi:hypothetical protein